MGAQNLACGASYVLYCRNSYIVPKTVPGQLKNLPVQLAFILSSNFAATKRAGPNCKECTLNATNSKMAYFSWPL